MAALTGLGKIQVTPAILVTGCPRSGTTWVGAMLAHSPPLAYIHEPFNPGYGERFTPARFPRQFELVTPASAPDYARDLGATLNFYYDLSESVRRLGRPRWRGGYPANLAEALATGVRFAVHRWLPCWRPLLKDPIALVSAEWLAQTFPMQVVVMLRNPLGVVSSLLRFPGMITPPAAFLEQPALLDLLPPAFEAELRQAEETIDQAIVQWRVLNQLALLYRERNPGWIFVAYEQLAEQPLAGFRSLCQQLKVPFTARMHGLISEHSHSRHSSEPAHPWVLKRDSPRSAQQWRKRLSEWQVGYISERCQDVWERVNCPTPRQTLPDSSTAID